VMVVLHQVMINQKFFQLLIITGSIRILKYIVVEFAKQLML